MLPSETLKPAKSMIASLGIGMQALSAVISTNTPGSPRASMTLVAASTIGFKMSASTSGASCECVPGWASSGGRQARTQGAAFAGGKGKPEDAAWRSSGAARLGAHLREVPRGQHYTRFGVPPKGESVARLKDPVYRRRAEQFVADAVL